MGLLHDHDDHLLGRAGFGTAHHTRHREIGYLFHTRAWGRALATELVGALVAWHHQHPDATMRPELRGYVYDTNTASCRVLRKTGFRTIGRNPRRPCELIYVNWRSLT